MEGKIDFVIPWVNGSDPKWQSEKKLYTKEESGDNRNIRYRDWDNLQYWFRGVDEYAPWVNKIHFITWGHLPVWLNKDHPKLNIVNHKDFIPNEYLPTYSSHVIELNLHRINGLSEKFVYFNDDTFIIDKMKKTDFFSKGLPCDIAVLMPLIAKFRNSTGSIVANNMEIINTNYNKNKVIKNNLSKWFHLTYKKYLISTLLMMPYKSFSGFLNQHLPNSFLKQTYKNLWKTEYDVLDKTCRNKFRDGKDVNQWLFRFTQLAEGEFTPRNPKIGRTFDLTNNNTDIIKAIKNQQFKMMCINDNDKDPVNDFEKERVALIEAFQKILPNKSQYEFK